MFYKMFVIIHRYIFEKVILIRIYTHTSSDKCVTGLVWAGSIRVTWSRWPTNHADWPEPRMNRVDGIKMCRIQQPLYINCLHVLQIRPFNTTQIYWLYPFNTSTYRVRCNWVYSGWKRRVGKDHYGGSSLYIITQICTVTIYISL